MTSTLRFQLNQRFQLAIIAPFTVVAVIAVLAALALVLNIDRRVVTVSAIVAGSYPAFVTISNIAARQRILRDIEQMLAGGYWAHWQYDPTFWQQHAPETLFGRTIRKYELSIPNLVRSGFLLALVSGIITGVSILWHSTVMSAITASLIVSIATFVATFLLFFVGQRNNQPDLDLDVVDVYVSPVGIYATDLPAMLLRLRYPGMEIRNITLERGRPSLLHFDIQYTATGKNSIQSVLRLPIPEDCLDEAAVLVSRLQAELVPQQSS